MVRSFKDDYLQAGTQTFAPLTGNPIRLGAEDIDGTINLIDTDLGLFTAAANLREVKIICCSRNSSLSEIRIAHIDGAIGAIVDEDYIFYDVELLPYETKIVNLDGAIASDTVLVRSSVVGVTFIANGQTMSQDYGYARLDATVVAADTDTALHTTISPTENITVVACNKDPLVSAYVRISAIDDTVIGSLSVEDYIIYDNLLGPNESKTYNLELDLPVNYTIGVKSTNANVNFLAYGRLQ